MKCWFVFKKHPNQNFHWPTWVTNFSIVRFIHSMLMLIVLRANCYCTKIRVGKDHKYSNFFFFCSHFATRFLNVTSRTGEGILSVSFFWNQRPFANNLNLKHGMLNTLNVVQTSFSVSVLSNSDTVIVVSGDDRPKIYFSFPL